MTVLLGSAAVICKLRSNGGPAQGRLLVEIQKKNHTEAAEKTVLRCLQQNAVTLLTNKQQSTSIFWCPLIFWERIPNMHAMCFSLNTSFTLKCEEQNLHLLSPIAYSLFFCSAMNWTQRLMSATQVLSTPAWFVCLFTSSFTVVICTQQKLSL